jgi:hypothetical protein
MKQQVRGHEWIEQTQHHGSDHAEPMAAIDHPWSAARAMFWNPAGSGTPQARRRTACGLRSVPRCRQATARHRQGLWKLVGEALAGGTEISDEEQAEVPPSAMKDLVEALDQIRRLARSYFLLRAVTVATRSSWSSRHQRGAAGEPGGAGDDDPHACLLW